MLTTAWIASTADLPFLNLNWFSERPLFPTKRAWSRRRINSFSSFPIVSNRRIGLYDETTAPRLNVNSLPWFKTIRSFLAIISPTKIPLLSRRASPHSGDLKKTFLSWIRHAPYPGKLQRLIKVSVNSISWNLRITVSESAVLSENDCIEILLNCVEDFLIV